MRSNGLGPCGAIRTRQRAPWPALVIIRTMRRLILALLIVLLPLRSGMGDAMAMQMASGGSGAPAAAVHGATGAHHPEDPASEAHHRPVHDVAPSAVALGDCADHGASGAPDASVHCQTCTFCQACHAVAIALTPPELAATRPADPLPFVGEHRFASAERARWLKPPIS